MKTKTIERPSILLLVCAASACAHPRGPAPVPPEPVAIVADAHEDELPAGHEATFGDVHVSIEMVATRVERGMAEVEHDLAHALVGPRPAPRILTLTDALAETFPLPSDRLYDAVQARALAQCEASPDAHDQSCSEQRLCHDTYAVVSDVRTGEIQRVHLLGTACGPQEDERSFVSVSARRTHVGRGVFVLVWDDTDDDPANRCSCNEESRSAHVVVLDGRGEKVFGDDAGFAVMTCPTGGSDSYEVRFRDVDHDGSKELVGVISRAFEARGLEVTDAAAGPGDGAPAVSEAWFVADFDVEALRTSSGSADAPAWCGALAPVVAPALVRAPSPSPTADPGATRALRPGRPTSAQRQALHQSGFACECGVVEACRALPAMLADLGHADFRPLVEVELVLAVLGGCESRRDDAAACQAAIFGPALADVPTARLRELLLPGCSDRDANACLALARLDYEAGVGVDAAEAVLIEVCEDHVWRDACALVVGRTANDAMKQRAARVLCDYGEPAACRESGLHAREDGLERRAREQYFAQSCP